jgi:RNA polymerase sigma factor (sigma-70 family)
MPKEEVTRWGLIRRAASGLAADQEEFARLYGPVAQAYLAARWKGGPLASEIEDAAQEVLLACVKDCGALSRADPSWPGGFRAYFHGVVRNTALKVERRHARHKDIPPSVEPALDDLPMDEPGLATVFDRSFARALIAEASRHLEERARERGGAAWERFMLLQLRFAEGRPIREIAVQQNESPARLHRRFQRAREEFREALLEVVAFHYPGTREEVEATCARLFASLA